MMNVGMIPPWKRNVTTIATMKKLRAKNFRLDSG